MKLITGETRRLEVIPREKGGKVYFIFTYQSKYLKIQDY